MLTERLPQHQYETQAEHLKQQSQNSARKNIVLINKITNGSHICGSRPLNVDQNSNRLCFSDLINDLKVTYPELNRAFFFLCINNTEYLVGADPFTTARHIDYGIFEGSSEIIILYTEQKHNNNSNNNNLKKQQQQQQQQQFSTKSTFQQQNEEHDVENQDKDVFYDINNNNQGNNNQDFQQGNENNSINSLELQENGQIEEKIQKEIQKYVKPREKRVKERTIEYVINKVKKWREIYENGINNEQGEHVKPNLDVAAYLVQLSRKTLDDYYAQLRKGEMYGFDFSTYKLEKMGVLRKYVKEQQKTNPNKKNKGKLDEIDSVISSVNMRKNTEEILSELKMEDNGNSNNSYSMSSFMNNNNLNINMQKVKIEEDQHQNLKIEDSNNNNVNLNNNINNNNNVQQSYNMNNNNNYVQQQYINYNNQNNYQMTTITNNSNDQQQQQQQQSDSNNNNVQQQLQIEEEGEEGIEEEDFLTREKEISSFVVKDEYDNIMREILRQSPIKSMHKASTDVCDIFMDLNQPSNDEQQQQQQQCEFIELE